MAAITRRSSLAGFEPEVRVSRFYDARQLIGAMAYSAEQRWMVSVERLDRHDDPALMFGCGGVGPDFPRRGTHTEFTVEDDAHRYTAYRVAERLLDELRDA